MIRTLPDPLETIPELGKEFVTEAESYVNENRTVFIDGDPTKRFVRDRKLPLPLTIQAILARQGQTQYADLMNFYDKAGTAREQKATAEAFRQRRMLINPEGIHQLMNHCTASVYLNHEDMMAGLYYNLILAAIDGTDCWVPRNTETEQVFGCVKENPDYNDPCMCKISGAYIPFDLVFADVRVGKYKSSEREHAKEHVLELEKRYPGKKFLFIMDRGYYSQELMYFLYSRGHGFIFRLPKETLYKYTKKVEPGDQKEFEIRFSRKDTSDLRNKNSLRNHILNTVFKLTVSKPLKKPEDVALDGTDDDSGYYILLSNLPAAGSERDNEILPAAGVEESRVLYRKGRWPIETAYGRIKDEFRLEDFTADNSKMILQEIYATFYAYNLTSLTVKSAWAKYPVNQGEYKLDLMPNFNKAVEQIKLNILKAVSEPDPEIAWDIWDEIYCEIARNASYKKESRYGPRRKKIKVRGRGRKRGS